MAGTHATFGLLAILFLSGSLVMLFFIILAGVSPSVPLNNTYFLQADTSGIGGARDLSRWTYFYICGDGNTDCSGPWPAPAFGWAWSAAGVDDVPDGLAGDYGNGTTSFYYFYMWRFGWVFYLMALFLIVMAWFSGFLACCGRLGSAIAGLVSAAALFFLTLAVSLMTATFVKARDAFRADGLNAEIGTYAFGFSWGAWAALFIATVLFCIGLRGDKGGYTGHKWRRTRSTRSRRSVDVGGGRRVKDDYS